MTQKWQGVTKRPRERRKKKDKKQREGDKQGKWKEQKRQGQAKVKEHGTKIAGSTKKQMQMWREKTSWRKKRTITRAELLSQPQKPDKSEPDDQNSSHHKSLRHSSKVICSMSRRRECGWNDPSLLGQPDYRQAITSALLIRVADKLAWHI